MKTIGLIVNPWAGIGGRVGLKGSDGLDVRRRALEMGAQPLSPRRTVEALRVLKGLEFRLVTYPGPMGEEEALEAGLKPHVIGEIGEETTGEDTRRAAKDMEALGVDLLLFAGGDGTARDVYSAIGDRVPVLGIPTGVKIHSAVFAVNPRRAGELVRRFLEGGPVEFRLEEVMDIDEEAFRRNILQARLYGYMKTLYAEDVIQGSKEAGVADDESSKIGAANELVEEMDPEALYILGPGTTVKPIADRLGLPKTLLGVDLVRGGKLVAQDANEATILQALEEAPKAKLVVGVVGGQGFVFGRGNQQISPEVIRRVGRENIVIIATPRKLARLGGRPLRVDTGDPELDQELRGYYKVHTGYGRRTLYKVA